MGKGMGAACCAIWLAISVVAVGAGVARADEEQDAEDAEAHDEEARTLFQAATMAYADGRFEDALSLFQRAYDLSGRAELLFNIGSAAERLRKDEVAIDAYEKYLAQNPNAKNRRFVESRLETLREQQASREAGEPVPTPEEAAEAAGGADQAGDEATALPDEGTAPVTQKWWFWTVIGGGAAAVVITVAVVAAGGGASPEYPADDVGGTVFTLGSGR